MSPEIKEVLPFTVHGLQVRTTNAMEQTPQAKIGVLWQRYFSSPAAAASGLYGVYSGYESDWTGAFDVTVGVQAGADQALHGEQGSVHVQGGEYLVFHARGAMPQAVIEAWQRVWAYFSAPRSDWRRCYATDFEQYISADQVMVCIGVKAA